MNQACASGSRLERKTQHATFHNPEECVHCWMYAQHLEGPVLVATETYSEMFRDGVYHGRLLQEEEDQRLLMQYRDQLQRSQRQYEDSVLMQQKFRHEIALMEAELTFLKDQLIAVQMAYDDVTMVHADLEAAEEGVSSARREGRVEAEPSMRDELRMQSTRRELQVEAGGFDAADYVTENAHFNQILRQLRIQDERRMRSMDIDAQDVDRYSIASDSDNDNESPRLAISVSSASSSNNPSRSQSVAPQPRGEDTPELTSQDVYSLLIDAQASGGDEARDKVALLLEDAEQTRRSSRTNAQLFLLRYRNEGRLGSLESRTLSSTLRPPSHAELTIEQVSSLMAATAGHTEGEALDQVNLLFEEAEKTPESMRTSVQLYLLRYWKRPPTLVPSLSVSPSNQRDVKLNIESCAASAEIFVDASWFGVGFVINEDHWVAWTFKKGRPEIPNGPDGRIVMSWAEIIAAELGIRTLIAAGYHKTAIILRSDNYGVIMALSRHTWTKNYGVDEILQRILRLCANVGLIVIPVWVPTRCNPADGPSRGLYPPQKLRFGYVPELPHYLQTFISQV